VSDNNGGNPRLDRIEGILETIVTVQRDMQQEHQMLLRAQVVQGEELRQHQDELRQLRNRTDEKFQSLAESQQRVDDALAVLLATVDEIIRRPRA
jgi:hypothetical protein